VKDSLSRDSLCNAPCVTSPPSPLKSLRVFSQGRVHPFRTGYNPSVLRPLNNGSGGRNAARKQAKTLTRGQADITLAYISTTRYPKRNRVIFLLSAKVGLRAKEIAGLTW
jgi:integrase